MRRVLQRLWSEGDHVLAAVSGGADSVALLLLLHEIARQGEIRLSCAHLDHGIRGEASRADARFVRALCERLGVPLAAEVADVPGLAALERAGEETVARAVRHAFLHRARALLGADWIALAHHADDQAETVLMHLLRGAGTRGASGMRPVEGVFIRPLLDVPKARLLKHLDSVGQAHVTDGTNLEPIGPRNRLRLEVMPALADIYPGAVPALCRHARIAAGEADLIDRLAADWFEARARRLPMGVLIPPDPGADRALVRRALARQLGCDADAVERALALYASGRPGKASLPGGWELERTGAGLYLLRGVAPPLPVPLADGAALGGCCTIRVRAALPVPVRDDPYRQALNLAALAGAELRTRRPGDRFQMLNAPGDRLLSDVLTDRKIDRPIRDFLPLVAVGSRVLWIPGLGVSEQAKLTPGCGAQLLTYEGEKLL